MLLLADALGITISYFGAFWFSIKLDKELSLNVYRSVFPAVLVGWLVVFRFTGLYNIRLRGSEEFFVLLKGVVIALVITLSSAFFYRPRLDDQTYFTFSRTLLILLAVLTVPVTLLFRHTFRWGRYKLFKTTRHFNRLIIVGHNELGLMLAKELKKHDLGYELVGFVEDFTPEVKNDLERTTGQTCEECWDRSPASESSDGLTRPADLPEEFYKNYLNGSSAATASDIPIIGRIDEIEKIIAEKEITDIWIALPSAPRERLMSLVNLCLKTKVSWKIVPDLYEVMLDWVHIDSLSGIPLIGIRRSNITGLNIIIKRVMDLVITSWLLILASPFLLLIAIFIKLTSPGPVLFKQKRVGQDGRRFVFLKFRSMYHKAPRTKHKEFTKKWIAGTGETTHDNSKKEKKVYKITDDPRITPIGKFLRKTSLDELPQFFSVFKGEMSLVGPRPPLAYEVEHYHEWHKRRLETKPGITGLWQVSGRNLLSFEEMVKLDIFYIENWSVRLDLQIIIKTVFTVLFHKAY